MSVIDTLTLSQRLSDGPIPASEALTYATGIAERLCELHDTGRIHAKLTPDCVRLFRTRVELDQPSDNAAPGLYTAPEVLAGQPADARTDVYSLGAMLYAMLKGPQAFEAVAGAESVGPFVSTGNAGLDRFLSQTVARDPAMRLQRMRKAVLELKFLGIAGRGQAAQSAAAVRAELERKIEVLNRRVESAEQQVEAMRQYCASLESELGDGFQACNRNFEKHAAAIESLQTTTEQTDQLVEQVVDALDLLQASVLDTGSAPEPANRLQQ